MPRELSDEICELTLDDKISGSTLTVYYRLPMPEERISYSNSIVKRKGKKIITQVGETRLKYGRAILTGIKDGDFSAGKKPLSSNPDSPDYNPAWKSFVEKYAADILMVLAATVFETNEKLDFDDESDDADEGAETGGNPF